MKNGKDIFIAVAVGLVAYGIYQWQQSQTATTPATGTTSTTPGTSTPLPAVASTPGATGETQTSVSEVAPGAVTQPLAIGEAID